MWRHLQRLSLGMFFIVTASAILLFSEVSKETRRERRQMRLAMFQMASQPIIDEGANGVIESLAAAGFTDGSTMLLKRYNAEGDTGTANSIAQELVGGQFDLIITLTTGALQIVANANKQQKVPHVFGLVSDPIKAGVGIGTDKMDHPAHLVGIGTFPPVDQAIEMARKLNPQLSRIGLAWNPAEINSEVCTRLAEKVCQRLNIELLQANVENTSAVKEAVSSLIDRRIDTLLIGGDVTMLGALEVVVKAGNDAKIPTFTCMPGNAAKGALFDVGANYYEVGRTVGQVAGRVLNGEKIADIPVEVAIPPKIFINQQALKLISGDWSFPADVVAKADARIDETGQRHDKLPPRTEAAKATTKLWQLRILSYITSPDVDEAERGLKEGLKKSGLVEGHDYAVKTSNAQGDMPTLNGLVDSAMADKADLILTISTQALQSAVQKASGTPIVFTMVANPFTAGVGKSETDHPPNVTGAYGANDTRRMMPLIRKLMPDAKSLGTLFVPSEVNSLHSYELLKQDAAAAKFELISRGVTAGTEMVDASQALCDQHPDAICLSNSNLTGSTFPTLGSAAARAKLPVFAFLGSTATQGASVVLTRDYYDMGLDSARLAARIIRGENPARIPYHNSTGSKLIVNPKTARECGLQLSDEFIKSADKVVDK